MSQPWPDSAVTMTLAAIAYQGDIAGQLRSPGYATAGDWSLVWGPVTDEFGNLAYVTKSASTGRYALVIRGTETTFSFATLENCFYDLDVLTQVLWPYFPDCQGCRISNGAFIQASNLTKASWSGQTLASFLTRELPINAILIVTGHSLGGNLASVLASWISSLRGPDAGQPDPNTQIYTFAAPSAGNTEFASAFNARFPQSWRYWNSLDVVPRAWDSLPDLDHIYDSIGICTPGDVEFAIDGMEAALLGSEAWYDSAYDQPNGTGTVLTGQAVNPRVGWLFEVEAQHASNTYLGLLGAPVIKTDLFVGPGALERGPVLRRPALKKGEVVPNVPPRRRSPWETTSLYPSDRRHGMGSNSVLQRALKPLTALIGVSDGAHEAAKTLQAVLSYQRHALAAVRSAVLFSFCKWAGCAALGFDQSNYVEPIPN